MWVWVTVDCGVERDSLASDEGVKCDASLPDMVGGKRCGGRRGWNSETSDPGRELVLLVEGGALLAEMGVKSMLLQEDCHAADRLSECSWGVAGTAAAAADVLAAA